MAFGLLDGLRSEYNVKIPEQLKVLGFDDIEQASWASYNLSTISQDIQQCATLAVELMMKRLKNPDNPLEKIDILLNPVHRGTTIN